MTAPVDVLAVMDRAAARAALLPELAADLTNARAAIAELIEALQEARDALTYYDGSIADPDNGCRWDSDVGYAVYQRAGAALARVWGS